jgi:hypothetical protein
MWLPVGGPLQQASGELNRPLLLLGSVDAVNAELASLAQPSNS